MKFIFILSILFLNFYCLCQDNIEDKNSISNLAEVDSSTDFKLVIPGKLSCPPVFTLDKKILILSSDNKIRQIDRKTGNILKVLDIPYPTTGNFFIHPTGAIYLGIENSIQVYTSDLDFIVGFPFQFQGNIMPLETGNLFLYNNTGFKIFTNLGEKISEVNFSEEYLSIARHFGLIVVCYRNKVICYNEFGEEVWSFSTKEDIKSVIRVGEGFLLNSEKRNIIINFEGKQITQERYLINAKLDNEYKNAIPKFAFTDGSMLYDNGTEFLYFDKDYNLKIKIKSILNSSFVFYDLTEEGFLFLGDKAWVLYGKNIVNPKSTKDMSIKAYPYINFGSKFASQNRFFNGESIFEIENYKKSFSFRYYNGLLEKRDRESLLLALNSIKETIANKEIKGKLQMYEYFLYRIASDMYTKTQKNSSGTITNNYPELRVEAIKVLNQIAGFSTKYKIMYLTNLEKDEAVLVQYIRLISSLLIDVNGNIFSWLYKIQSLNSGSKSIAFETIRAVYLVSKYSYKLRTPQALQILDLISAKIKYPEIRRFAQDIRKDILGMLFTKTTEDLEEKEHDIVN